ncbi:MAG: alpha/beta-type small acid-soluble spore protein [Eubacteriales bacterium]|nr:alpha/beta-type small acid-soluble spore protein [Eubacteriales bacterium]
MASTSKSNKAALSNMKYEIASEIGVNLKQGYNGDLTSQQAGSVGGEMVRRMIAQYEASMGGTAFNSSSNMTQQR